MDALKAEYAQLFEILRRLVDPNLAITPEINEAKKLIEAGGDREMGWDGGWDGMDVSEMRM